MQKLKKLLFISMIPFLSCSMNAQQQGLGCEATNIMAGVVAAGVAYKAAYAAICFVVSPVNVSYSEGLGGLKDDHRHLPDYALDIVYNKGLYPALVTGTFTAVAARSGSWPQLSVKDVIKPTVWGFGSLFGASMLFVFYSGKYRWELNRQLKEIGKKRVVYTEKIQSTIDWERFVIGYAHKAVIVGLPLWVLYQRYQLT